MRKKDRRILRHAVSRRIMENFFKEKLPYFYPKANLLSFSLKDQSPYKFKKSVRYTLKLSYPSGKKEERIIRANVPSVHQAWEIKVSNQALEYLYHHGFDRGKYQVTRPLGQYPERRMQLYEEYPGKIFTNLILKGKGDLKKSTLLASNWVAKFHNLKAKIGRPKTFQRIKEEIGYFNKDYQRYSQECYRDGRKILAVFFKKFKKSYRPKKHHLIHGDLNSNNIVINNSQVGVIDFGNAWRFNPLCDVANYFVQLELLAWQGKVPLKLIQRLNSDFLKNYLRKTKQDNKKSIEQINLWKVWWMMQITAFCVSILVDTKKNREALERTIIRHTIPQAKKIFKL